MLPWNRHVRGRVDHNLTVKELREHQISAAAIRHFVFTTHYRKELNFSEEALEASIEAVRRVGELAERLEEASGGTDTLGTSAKQAQAEFRAAIFDDLNAPEALAALFTFLKSANRELDRNGIDGKALDRARSAFAEMNGVLDVVPGRESASAELAKWVEDRLAARDAARGRRDFAEADRIRAELAEQGIAVEDAGGGTEWKVVRSARAS